MLFLEPLLHVGPECEIAEDQAVQCDREQERRHFPRWNLRAHPRGHAGKVDPGFGDQGAGVKHGDPPNLPGMVPPHESHDCGDCRRDQEVDHDLFAHILSHLFRRLLIGRSIVGQRIPFRLGFLLHLLALFGDPLTSSRSRQEMAHTPHQPGGSARLRERGQKGQQKRIDAGAAKKIPGKNSDADGRLLLDPDILFASSWISRSFPGSRPQWFRERRLKDLREYIAGIASQLRVENKSPDEVRQIMAEYEQKGLEKLIEDKLILAAAIDKGIEVRDDVVDKRLEEIKGRYTREDDFIKALIHKA